MINVTINMSDKKNKMKNPCKVCSKPVTDKTGRRCEGVCRKWIHYNCLDYPPEKIDAIKEGIIKITCPCPNCENEKDKKSNKKDPGTISGNCGKANCPAIDKVDSELKCFGIPAPCKPYLDAVTMIEDYSVLFNASVDKSVGTNSSVEKLVLRVSRAESPPREHRRTSPMRGHQATGVSPYDILLETSFLNPEVHVTTSPAIFPCSESCSSLCSQSRPQHKSINSSKEQGTDAATNKLNPPDKLDPLTGDIKCPYCKTRIILGGIPRRLYQRIQEQKQSNFVVECSESEGEVSPCFEYKSSKNQNEPTMTQKMIEQCLKRPKNAIPNVSSVTSVATSFSPKLESSNDTQTTDMVSEACEMDDSVPNALAKLVARLYENLEEMQNQFKILVHYFNCPNSWEEK